MQTKRRVVGLLAGVALVVNALLIIAFGPASLDLTLFQGPCRAGQLGCIPLHWRLALATALFAGGLAIAGSAFRHARWERVAACAVPVVWLFSMPYELALRYGTAAFEGQVMDATALALEIGIVATALWYAGAPAKPALPL